MLAYLCRSIMLPTVAVSKVSTTFFGFSLQDLQLQTALGYQSTQIMRPWMWQLRSWPRPATSRFTESWLCWERRQHFWKAVSSFLLSQRISSVSWGTVQYKCCMVVITNICFLQKHRKSKFPSLYIVLKWWSEKMYFHYNTPQVASWILNICISNDHYCCEEVRN